MFLDAVSIALSENVANGGEMAMEMFERKENMVLAGKKAFW